MTTDMSYLGRSVATALIVVSSLLGASNYYWKRDKRDLEAKVAQVALLEKKLATTDTRMPVSEDLSRVLMLAHSSQSTGELVLIIDQYSSPVQILDYRVRAISPGYGGLQSARDYDGDGWFTKAEGDSVEQMKH